MKHIIICLCSLILALFSNSCQRAENNATVPEVQPSLIPHPETLTLSGEQLIFLDWYGGTPSGAKVIGKRVVPDSGIEFDIHFPSNRPGYRSIDYVSSGEGGRGALIGFDISGYKTFALTFTLVSIDGATGSEVTQELIVGAVIGPTAEGKLSDYTPVRLGFSSGQTTAVSRTPVFGTSNIYQIGIHAHMVKPEGWNPSGSMVTIRVEPIPDTPTPPWPNLSETPEQENASEKTMP